MKPLKAKIQHIYKNGEGWDEEPTSLDIVLGTLNRKGGKFLTSFDVESGLQMVNGVDYAEQLAWAYADGYNHCLDDFREQLAEIFGDDRD